MRTNLFDDWFCCSAIDSAGKRELMPVIDKYTENTVILKQLATTLLCNLFHFALFDMCEPTFSNQITCFNEHFRA